MTSNVTPMRINDPRSAHGPHQVIADNLAAEMARKRISGRQASRELGVKQMYVARRVSGEVELSAIDLVAFARLLDIDVKVLLAGMETAPSPIGETEPSGFSVKTGRFGNVIALPTRDTTKPERGHLAPVTPIGRTA